MDVISLCSAVVFGVMLPSWSREVDWKELERVSWNGKGFSKVG